MPRPPQHRWPTPWPGWPRRWSRRARTPATPRREGRARRSPPARSSPADAAATAAGEAVPARVPLRLPGGMFDDSVEAAEHLLRTPGVGPGGRRLQRDDDGVARARRRPSSAGGCSPRCPTSPHRTSTPVELVFDGAEVEPLSVPAPTRRAGTGAVLGPRGRGRRRDHRPGGPHPRRHARDRGVERQPGAHGRAPAGRQPPPRPPARRRCSRR